MQRPASRTRLESLASVLAVLAALVLAAPPARPDGPRWRPLPWGVARTRGRAAIACPADMVAVVGMHCPEVDETCLAWSDDNRGRCLRYAEPVRCLSRHRVPMAYCIDRYEWPDRAGMHPDVMVSFDEAQMFCAGRGRRLCSESEWTFACSGESLRPYPYGFVRDPAACTIDRYALAPDHALLQDPFARYAEAARVYLATASGTMPRCASSFGAMDMTGNVDEWVASASGVPFASALMGGFWGHVRDRCRAVTREHDERFRYYQIGFRCCSAGGR